MLCINYRLTIAKVDNVASEVWKFQRYRLIADFTERFCLPPPFTLFSFVYMFIKILVRGCIKCKRRLAACCEGERVRHCIVVNDIIKHHHPTCKILSLHLKAFCLFGQYVYSVVLWVYPPRLLLV